MAEVNARSTGLRWMVHPSPTSAVVVTHICGSRPLPSFTEDGFNLVPDAAPAPAPKLDPCSRNEVLLHHPAAKGCVVIAGG